MEYFLRDAEELTFSIIIKQQLTCIKKNDKYKFFQIFHNFIYLYSADRQQITIKGLYS